MLVSAGQIDFFVRGFTASIGGSPQTSSEDSRCQNSSAVTNHGWIKWLCGRIFFSNMKERSADSFYPSVKRSYQHWAKPLPVTDRSPKWAFCEAGFYVILEVLSKTLQRIQIKLLGLWLAFIGFFLLILILWYLWGFQNTLHSPIDFLPFWAQRMTFHIRLSETSNSSEV